MAVFVNFNHKLAYKTITLKQANLFTIKDKSVLKEGRCVEIVDMIQVLRGGVIGSQHIMQINGRKQETVEVIYVFLYYIIALLFQIYVNHWFHTCKRHHILRLKIFINKLGQYIKAF